MNIKQGDAYAIPVTIKQNGEAIALSDIQQIEFYIGGYRKLYPGEVIVDQSTGIFYVPITQDESFSWEENSPIYLDIRVKFNGGNVQGILRQIGVGVVDAISQEVL